MKRTHMVAMLACLMLAGCERPAGAPTEPANSIMGGNENVAAPAVSVMRPSVVEEIEPPSPPPPPEPFEATVLFESGAALTDAAKARLDEVVAAAARAGDAPITIRGSTDSQGDDNVNRRASMRRAEAVRDYLAGQGIAPERMTTVALGEGRPVAPNVRLDGEPDEEGRRRNRRVDITVAPPAPNVPNEPAPAPSATPSPAGQQ